MHPIQEKLLALSGRYDLKKMSLRQIGRLINVDHPQKVKFHLGKLGIIEEKKERPDLVKSPFIKNENLLSIPVLGLANCGEATIFAESNIQSMLSVSKKLIDYKDYNNLFAVKAVGSSMNRADINGKNIQDGDFVIVDGENRNIENGEYVLSIIGGLANIKKFIKDDENRQIVLKSESDQYFSPTFIHEEDLDDYLINGKVVDVIKQDKSEDIIYEPV